MLTLKDVDDLLTQIEGISAETTNELDKLFAADLRSAALAHKDRLQSFVDANTSEAKDTARALGLLRNDNEGGAA